MTASTDYAKLPTEGNNPRSRHIDRMSITQALRLINNEDAKVASAVRSQIPVLDKAVVAIVFALKSKGRLIFIGAGTSGRLGILEAAECPPTFNTPPAMVQAIMAGGKQSVFRSKEGAEDKGSDAARQIKSKVRENDVVVGVAASGVTPFVREGLIAAKKKGAATILVTCHSGKFLSPADHTIQMKTGPEVIAGSTRLKAATATKMALNMMTVASMVQMGKVFGNRMVDLQPRSAKLKARATRLIQQIAGVSKPRAAQLLNKAGGNAKTAIVMAVKKLPKKAAQQLLNDNNGLLHLSLQ